MRPMTLAVAATIVATSLTSAGAAPAHLSAMTSDSVRSAVRAADVAQIQWRHGARGYWPGRGWAPRRFGGAAVVGGVLVGSAIVAAAIAERRAEASALRACARDYRAFDYESGTYIDAEGDVRVCPYLY